MVRYLNDFEAWRRQGDEYPRKVRSKSSSALAGIPSIRRLREPRGECGTTESQLSSRKPNF